MLYHLTPENNDGHTSLHILWPLSPFSYWADLELSSNPSSSFLSQLMSDHVYMSLPAYMYIKHTSNCLPRDCLPYLLDATHLKRPASYMTYSTCIHSLSTQHITAANQTGLGWYCQVNWCQLLGHVMWVEHCVHVLSHMYHKEEEEGDKPKYLTPTQTAHYV